MTDAQCEAALRKAYEAFWNDRGNPHASIRAAIDAYELHLRETQPAPAPSGMTETERKGCGWWWSFARALKGRAVW